MFRKHIFLTIVLVISLGTMSVALADVNAVTPSTNDINRDMGWAHVDQVAVGPGFVTLQFISTRNFYSCFEYRTDGDTSQMTDPTNPNDYITDGLYPYECEYNSSDTLTINANKYVEVRTVFGAETDERFDWTEFEVNVKNDCKNGGWEKLSRDDGSPFKNQGDCIQYFNTGK